MSNEMIILSGTAATIGFIHTVLGPDHYLPFIVLSKARKWAVTKTIAITLLCGIGHVLSSIILGFIGLALGIAVFRLEAIESSRSEIAAWFLIAFGLTYFVWGIHKAVRMRNHEHSHPHEDGEIHSHNHEHISVHSHIHTSKSGSLTPWVLFIIFIFGPCEPLIPLIMYPAAMHNMVSVVTVAIIFGLVTISTMLGIVLASSYGLSKLPINMLEKYSHALAGLAILLCGSTIKFLGL